VPVVFWLALALFVITDAIVIVFVVRRFRANLPGSGFAGARTGPVLASAHAMVGEYLRANYSGDPSHLATALGGLIPHVRELLRAQGIEPRPDVVRALVEVSATRHRVASPRQIREALQAIG